MGCPPAQAYPEEWIQGQFIVQQQQHRCWQQDIAQVMHPSTHPTHQIQPHGPFSSEIDVARLENTLSLMLIILIKAFCVCVCVYVCVCILFFLFVV